MAVDRWTIAFGFGALFLVAAVAAATWNISVTFSDSGLGASATFGESSRRDIGGVWNCGNVINPIDDHEPLDRRFNPQAACNEQVGTYRLFTMVPLGLGILTLMYGARLKRTAAREPDNPQEVPAGHT